MRCAAGALLHGKQPSADDWAAAGTAHPTRVTVVRVFGTWSDAIRAAGFTPRPGVGAHLAAENRARTVELYRSGLTLGEVAQQLGLTRAAIRNRLAASHEPLRSPWESRRLKTERHPPNRTSRPASRPV